MTSTELDEMLELLRCPVCKGGLTGGADAVSCDAGHRYPLLGEVPDLIADGRSAARISETFSAQWGDYVYGADRTWNRTLDARVEGFLTHLQISLDELTGKRVLDAGCGNGELTNEIAVRSAADVYGTDISTSVFRAQRSFPSVRFFRSDLMAPTIRPGVFDLVYCGGVLHHTPDTRRALEQLAPAVKPGGRIYVWLYWHVAGRSMSAKYALRRITRLLPPVVQQPVVDVLALPPYLRRRGGAWRDHRLVAHDFYTPRYRWEHTPDQLERWFRELGFSRVELISEARDGFGMLARETEV